MDSLPYIQMMMRNNVNEGLAASELYNNNLCLLCDAIELHKTPTIIIFAVIKTKTKGWTMKIIIH